MALVAFLEALNLAEDFAGAIETWNLETRGAEIADLATATAEETEPLIRARPPPPRGTPWWKGVVGGGSALGGVALQGALADMGNKQATHRKPLQKKYVPVSKKPPSTNMPGTRYYGGSSRTSRQGQKPGTIMQAHDSSHNTEGDEVPIVPPPRKMAKIHPDYFSINLPYCFREDSFNLNTFVYNNRTPLMTIRLNSIYDPLKAIRTGNDTEGNPLTNPNQQSNRQPAGRDIWAAHFKYYRVLGASVKVTLVQNGRAPTQTESPFQNSFMFGYELTDEDGQISDRVETFCTTKNAERMMLGSATNVTYHNGVAAVVDSTNVRAAQFVYKYNPAEWNYHVEEKSGEERWTPISQNPGIDHELQVRLFHLNDLFGPSGLGAVLVQINYQVQFREALDSFYKADDTTVATYGGTGEDPIDD